MKNKEITASADISNGLWLLLNRTRHLIIKARQRELRQHGLSIRNSAVVQTVARLGHLSTPVKIARQLLLERHTISEQLARMEKLGLIRKVKDLGRKNLLRIELTEEGHEASRKSAKRKSTTAIMSALTPEEQTELWYLLSKLHVRAMKHLRLKMKKEDIYPPLDPTEL